VFPYIQILATPLISPRYFYGEGCDRFIYPHSPVIDILPTHRRELRDTFSRGSSVPCWTIASVKFPRHSLNLFYFLSHFVSPSSYFPVFCFSGGYFRKSSYMPGNTTKRQLLILWHYGPKHWYETWNKVDIIQVLNCTNFWRERRKKHFICFHGGVTTHLLQVEVSYGVDAPWRPATATCNRALMRTGAKTFYG